MFTFLKQFAVLLTTLTILMSSTASIAPSAKQDTAKKTITIKNGTKFSIDNIFISADEEDHWGDDLLGDDEILKPGELIEVEVDCGKWDVKIIAEDDSECQLEDITLCKADEWKIVADC